MWSMVAERLTQIAPPTATPDHLWQHVEAAWSAVPQEHIQSLFESIPRHDRWYYYKYRPPPRSTGVMDVLSNVWAKVTSEEQTGEIKEKRNEVIGWVCVAEDRRRALDGEKLRALKKGGPRSEWKGRRGDERRWRWRIGVI
ncbi:hypothetical protein TNCV_3133431 [Trichonephila clavipes]|nr:hypothetical protein TNCV_3133431 [Trichonephila clavipes]